MSIFRRDVQRFHVNVREPGWFDAAFERIIQPDPTPATDLTPEQLALDPSMLVQFKQYLQKVTDHRFDSSHRERTGER